MHWSRWKRTTSHCDENTHEHTGCGRAKNDFSVALNFTNYPHVLWISLDMAQKALMLWTKVGQSGK